jgi:N-methylhydantoinase A
MPRAATLRIAIDTGGTFTDCVWVGARGLEILKVFSTPRAPADAIVGAVGQILAGRARPAAAGVALLHGTTVGTNTLLERKGGRIALVTTAGFEDVLVIGRQARPRLYDFFFTVPPALVPAERRLGADERVAADGSVLRPLAPGEVRRAPCGARGLPSAPRTRFIPSFASTSARPRWR